MEFEANRRSRLNVAHARQEQRRQQLPVRQSVLDFDRRLLDDAFSRRLFEELHQRFDVVGEASDALIDLHFLGREWPKCLEDAAQTEAAGGGCQKLSPLDDGHCETRL